MEPIRDPYIERRRKLEQNRLAKVLLGIVAATGVAFALLIAAQAQGQTLIEQWRSEMGIPARTTTARQRLDSGDYYLQRELNYRDAESRLIMEALMRSANQGKNSAETHSEVMQAKAEARAMRCIVHGEGC